jgi:hypothetical protein
MIGDGTWCTKNRDFSFSVHTDIEFLFGSLVINFNRKMDNIFSAVHTIEKDIEREKIELRNQTYFRFFQS